MNVSLKRHLVVSCEKGFPHTHPGCSWSSAHRYTLIPGCSRKLWGIEKRKLELVGVPHPGGRAGGRQDPRLQSHRVGNSSSLPGWGLQVLAPWAECLPVCDPPYLHPVSLSLCLGSNPRSTTTVCVNLDRIFHLFASVCSPVKWGQYLYLTLP